MVTVVAPKNQLHNVINVALSLNQLQSEGKKVNVALLDKTELNHFWSKLDDYVDNSDKSLIILDVPHPEANDMDKIKTEPWKNAILYLSSELNPLTKEEKEGLLNYGISVVPERKSYECFMGDITPDNQKWVDIAKILTRGEKDGKISSREKRILEGIINLAITFPLKAIEKIRENAFDYFYDAGMETPDITIRTKEGYYHIIEVKKARPGTISAVYRQYIEDLLEPLIIDGAMKAIMTRNPTFFQQIIHKEKGDLDSLTFGKVTLFRFNKHTKSEKLLTLAGRGHCKGYVLKIGEPRFMNSKTLQRQLIGGSTIEKKGAKTYPKRYRGLKDEFAGIGFLSKDLVQVPEGALEDAVAIFHRSGTPFSVLACSHAPISS